MSGVLEKHGKKIMAIAGAVLMLAFISPLGRQNQSRTQLVVGYIGKESITQNDVDLAKAEAEFMTQRLMVEQRVPGEPGKVDWAPVARTLGLPGLWQAIKDDPRLLLLITHEASMQGLAPIPSQVEEIAKQANVAVVDEATNRIVPIDDLPDYGQANLAKLSLGSWISLLNEITAAERMIKVTEPMRQQQMALVGQTITLQVVSFSAQDEMRSVPDPTAEQLKQQFDKYGDVQPPARGTQDNPFAFGYKYPARVKLQFIEVPIDEVRRAVKASKTPYDWEVAGRAYYLKNQNEFATTEPTSQPMDLLPTAPRPATTRPFEDVKTEAIEAAMAPEIDDLSMRVETKIGSILQSDWLASHATSAAGPTTAPTMTHVPLESDDYLNSIAQKIQAEDGVICKVVRIGTLMDATQLRGDKSLAELLKAQTSTGTDLTELASAVPAICIAYQPSDAMHDTLLQGSPRSAFFVRFSGMRPPEKPASMDEIHAQLVRDWKLTQAMALATKEATDLVKAAETKSLSEVVAAEAKTGKKIELITTTPFIAADEAPPDLGISAAAGGQFQGGVTHLLEELARKEKPLAAIDLQADGRALAAQIVSVEPKFKSVREYNEFMAAIDSGLKQQLGTKSGLLEGWLDLDRLMSRLKYVDLNPKKKNTASTEPT